MNEMTDLIAASTATLDRVADFTLRLAPSDIPRPVLERAGELLLDTLGVAIASAPMKAGVLAREAAVKLYGTTDPALSAHMLFDGRAVSVAGAA